MAKDPFVIFEAQHEEGLKQLERLEGAVERLRASEASPELWKAIRGATAFINGEVRLHNQKEEELLFPPLEEVLPPGGPTAVMRDEHRALWSSLGRLEEAISRWEKGDRAAKGEVINSARFMVELLRAHIRKENEVLYPMARRLLGPEKIEGMAQRLEAQEGPHPPHLG